MVEFCLNLVERFAFELCHDPLVDHFVEVFETRGRSMILSGLLPWRRHEVFERSECLECGSLPTCVCGRSSLLNLARLLLKKTKLSLVVLKKVCA